MRIASERFLIDANAIITPYLNYYPFDFAPKFWEQLEINIENGSITILDLVKDEITKGEDSLSEWLKKISIGSFVDHRDGAIVGKYSEILQYIQTAGCYNSNALIKWSQNNVADPWLIATAKICNYTIITFEKPVGSLSDRNPSGNPKIPDICTKFEVEYNDLFYMMRQLSFKLG